MGSAVKIEMRFKPETMAQLGRAIRRIGEKGHIAIARSLNRAETAAETVMARNVAADLGIRQGDVKKEFRRSPARPDKLSARLEVSGARIPLIAFRARGPEPSRGRGRGVAYTLQGTRGRVETAFIAKMKSGHRGVFKRVSPSARRSQGAWGPNLPIVQLYGPSLPHVFAKHAPEGLARGEEQLKKNLAHEFRWAIQQAASTS